jgi:hypothetical protein
MENQNQKQNYSDEVDIAQFFRWVGRGFSRVGSSTIYGIASLRRVFYSNRVFFVGIIVLGLILGALYSKLLKKDYFKSSMVLSCDYLNTQILQNTIEKFNLLAQEKDKEGIAQELNLELSTARSIQKFEFRSFVSEDDVVEMEVLREQLNNVTGEKKELVEKVIDRLQIDNKNAYEISVFVYDPNTVKPLETALIDYFSNNSYIKRRIDSNTKTLLARKSKLQKELRKLDSLKLVLFQNYQTMAQKSRGSNNVVVGEEGLANPLEVFSKDLELYKELQDVQTKLDLKPDFEIVDGFTPFKEPESASLLDVLAISLFLSIIIGYLILGAYRFDRMLATYPTS